jgi:Leucine-rich repeat (LRR) protein
MKTLIVSSLVLVSSGVAVNSFITKDLEVTGQKTVYSIEQLNTLDTLSIENVFLSAINLSEIPQNVFHFSNLEKLDLSSNSIVSIPKEIASLKKLNSLNLSDNPTLELNECFPNLSKLELKQLNISNCALVYLPYSIGQMKELTTLNVSNNALIDIPFYLGKLKKLEDLDLSANQLSSLDFTLYKMKNLKYLNLENNPNLDMKNVCLNLMALKNLNEVKFSHLKDTLPASFGNIKSFSLYISNSFISQLSPTIGDNKYLQSITFKDCPETQFKTILPVLATAPSLTEVTLNNCFGELPAELKLLDKLTYLNLSGNQLTYLPISQKDYPYLKQLVLYDNNFSEEEWKKIVSNFPNVEILSNNYAPAPTSSNDLITNTKNQEIRPIAKHLDIVDSTYNITNNTPVILNYHNTSISIPKNAFVDSEGKIVNEPISISYREFNNPADIFLSGIPMGYDSAGISTTFESGGMFEFKAKTNTGELVYPNPKSPIKIDFSSVSSDLDFNKYSFDDSNNLWKYEGASSIDSTVRPKKNLRLMPIYSMGLPKPIFQIQGISIEIQRGNTIEIFKTQNTSGAHLYSYPKMLFKPSTFEYYDDYKAKKTRKELQIFNKRYVRKFRQYKNVQRKYRVPFVDFMFEIDKEKDCFLVTVLLSDTLLEIPVKLKSKSNLDREQKNYVSFWKKYTKELKENERANALVEKRYEKELSDFENELNKYQREYRNWSTNNDEESKIIRSVILKSFSIWNIDRMGKMEEPAYIAVKLFNKENKPFEAHQYIVMDYTDNGVLTYATNYICYDKSNKTVLLALDKDNNVMIVNSNDFKSIKNVKNESTVTFHLDPIDIKSLSADQFKSLVN